MGCSSPLARPTGADPRRHTPNCGLKTSDTRRHTPNCGLTTARPPAGGAGKPGAPDVAPQLAFATVWAPATTKKSDRADRTGAAVEKGMHTPRVRCTAPCHNSFGRSPRLRQPRHVQGRDGGPGLRRRRRGARHRAHGQVRVLSWRNHWARVLSWRNRCSARGYPFAKNAGMVRHTSRISRISHGVALCGMVCHGVAWCGMVWHGVAWCGMVCHGALTSTRYFVSTPF